jgi:phospho-N-acetylmuramoyl-pentapeptide-transferase
VIALLVGAGFSLLFSLLLTPLFARAFRKFGWGQFIRDDGPEAHHAKRGTATMGGVVFIVGSVLGYFIGHLAIGYPVSRGGVLALAMMVGLGLVGFVDDFLKTRKQQSLGLGGWSKILGQVIVGTVFALIVILLPDAYGIMPASHFISAVRDVPWLNLFFLGPVVGVILFVIWTNLITVSASNGVNVTDGLDGLATGASIFAFGGYVFIGFWQSKQWCLTPERLDPGVIGKCYQVAQPVDLAIVAACIVGGLIGFLWWNTTPAQIFMGDTGSLGLGGGIAALAILTRTELLLVFIGGLFFITTGSVILQRIWFKITKRVYGQGRRIFLMSPLHHHFELKGWAEVTVVVRFWLIAALFVAVGVGLFYLEWTLS